MAPTADWPSLVGGLAGWRRRGAAFLFGALMTAALPPVHAVVVLVPAFVGLLWLVDSSQNRVRAFGAGWWFGFGYFSLGLYWIAFALLTDAAKFGWMVPFAVFGLAAAFSIYIGIATLVLWSTGLRGLARIIMFAILWTLAEFARGMLLTGFPWNLVGQVWAFSDNIIQVSAIIGVYGLGCLTVLAATMPALWWGCSRPLSKGAAIAIPIALFAALWLGGSLRLANSEFAEVPGVELRIVQPNIRQADKWKQALRDTHLIKTMRLTVGPGWESITHVVWPEAAIPFFIGLDEERRRALAQVVPENGLLIAGAPRFEPKEEAKSEVWNALHAFDPDGKVVATYDKFHLVPFGEYVPLRTILPIEKITAGASDFSAGPGIRTMDVPGLPAFSPLICYEGIFPGAVVDPNDPPDWLLNVTNDAWFGITAGPHQHFAAVRMRAVEEGLPLVRAANNGISALVDPYGRVLAQLNLGDEGVLDVRLPSALASSTPFSRFGIWSTIGLLLILAIIVCISYARERPT